MDDRAEIEKRLVDLELRFMQQEKLAWEQNSVIVAQQREIDRLAVEIRALREQIFADPDATMKDERPPHY